MRSIMEPKKASCCYLCGEENIYLEEHHVFEGTANRKMSERYGLKVHLCYMCHRDSKLGVHFNKERREELQRMAQEVFEKSHSREVFMKIFGKNWL